MNTTLTNRFILTLMDDIAAIGPGSTFERFGCAFLQGRLGISLELRGSTVNGHPVGYTVDTYSDDGKIIGEFSVDKNYFDSEQTKPRGDFDHALSLHPNATHIHLLSNQQPGPKPYGDATRAAGSWADERGVEVTIYDGRRIATEIVSDLLPNERAIDELAEFAPRLRQIQEEFAANNALPTPSQAYRQREIVETEIVAMVTAQPVTYIAGIGGSGKSQVAAAVARKLRSSYDSAYWIDAQGLTAIEELRATPIARGGSARNVASLLKNLRCLLILDDLTCQWDPQQLIALCGSQSRILITQRSSSPGCYPLPTVDEGIARAILEFGVEACPDPAFKAIYDVVGGHPLTLSLINGAVAEGWSWADVAEDCGSCAEYVDDRNDRVASRVLGRVLGNLTRETALFRWLGSPQCDRLFARYFLRVPGLQKLERFCLISASSPGVVRLHDIVFACLGGFDPPTAETGLEMENALDAYLTNEAYNSDLDLVAVARASRGKLEQLMRSGREWSSFLLALLSIWSPQELDRAMIGDPMRFLRGIAGRPPTCAEVSLPLEAMECLYRSDKEIYFDTAKDNLQLRLSTWVEELKRIPGLSPRSRLDVSHHEGKALKLLGKIDEAKALFESVVAADPNHYAAKLQLIRILSSAPEGIERAVKLVESIFHAASESPSAVTTSVLLASIADFAGMSDRSEESARIWAQYGPMFKERIIHAGNVDSDLAYTSFAPIARYWAYNNPADFRDVWESIPMRAPDESQNDGERFAIGDVLREAAARLPLHDSERSQLQRDALVWMTSLKKPAAFHKQTLGKLYVEMGQFEAAKEVLKPLPPNAWVKFWLAKAELGSGNDSVALLLIDEALANLTAQKFRSTFLSVRHDIQRALGAREAVNDLDQAIASCENEKFKGELVERRTKFYG